MGRNAPTAAGETLAGWLPSRITGPVVIVAGPVVVGAALVVGPVVVVGPVMGAMLVVVTSVVVDAAVVVVGAVVVGPTVVDGAVTVGWVVAPRTEGAVVVVVPPTVAGAWAVAGPVVVVGLLTARRPKLGVVEGGGVVVNSRGAVVVDADVGAGLVGTVGSATPGTRCGGSGWGGRVAEATRAARTAVVSPKTNSSNLQGRRGLARCRGAGVGMVHHPGSAGSSGFLGVPGSRPLTRRIRRSCAQRIERYVPASLTDVSPRTCQASGGQWPRWRCCLAGSVPHLDLAPEAVDPGRSTRPGLLERLMGLVLHDLEAGAGDQLGNGAAKLRARGRVAAAGQDEGRGGDLREVVGRVVVEEGVQVALQVLGRLLVREGQHLLDELGDGPVVVGPGGVDARKNPSRNARSLGANSTSQRTNSSRARR
jgi:hypothetical protein